MVVLLHGPELSHMRKITKTHHTHNITHSTLTWRSLKSVFTVSFIRWCAVRASKICEQMITRMSGKSQIFNYGFLWRNGCYFCTGVRVEAESTPGVVRLWHDWLHRRNFTRNFGMSRDPLKTPRNEKYIFQVLILCPCVNCQCISWYMPNIWWKKIIFVSFCIKIQFFLIKKLFFF